MRRRNSNNNETRKLLILLVAIIAMSCFALASCSKEATPDMGDAENAIVAAVEETSAANLAAEEPQTEPEEAAAEPEPEAETEPAADTASMSEDSKEKDSSKKESKNKSSSKKSSSAEKEKKWVDPVYKTVNHPEEGHYETVTEWYCLCGEYVGSKEGWKKHREDFIESNGGVCNGEHVRPDPKETQVWVVDKAAWTEQVMVSEGHWE